MSLFQSMIVIFGLNASSSMFRCSSVASPVLVNMSAMLGLVMSIAFCLGDPESLIISSRINSVSWQQWATFTGGCCECSRVYAESPGLSVSGLLAFTTLTRSLQLVSPNLVSSLRCVELVLAFAVQSLITLQEPSIITCGGSGLIILGVLILAFQVRNNLNQFQSILLFNYQL